MMLFLDDKDSGLTCNRCGGSVTEFSISHTIWNAAIRYGGKERDDEYICLDCWDRAKSVALARFMGWTLDRSGRWFHPGNPNKNENEAWINDLYKPSKMYFAWQVMQYLGDLGLDDMIDMWFSNQSVCMESPTEAQRMWLDKCLELAIENGLAQTSPQKSS